MPPPVIENFEGTSIGEINRQYEYSFSANDSDNNPIAYFVDWGDGTNSGWTMDYEQGAIISLSHEWTQKNIYNIKVKARDSAGEESEWSEHLIVNMTMETDVKFQNRILFSKVIFQNKGDYELHNVELKLKIYHVHIPYFDFGVILFPTEPITVSVDLLKCQEKLNIQTRVRGFGTFQADLTYKTDELPNPTVIRANGFVIGPFIIFVIKEQ